MLEGVAVQCHEAGHAERMRVCLPADIVADALLHEVCQRLDGPHFGRNKGLAIVPVAAKALEAALLRWISADGVAGDVYPVYPGPEGRVSPYIDVDIGPEQLAGVRDETKGVEGHY